MPIIGGDLRIAVGSRECLASDRMDRQSGGDRADAHTAALNATNRQRWGLSVCLAQAEARNRFFLAGGPLALHPRTARQAFAQRHRPSSARGTGPKRNTAPQGLPRSQKASAESNVVVLYAKSLSILASFGNLCQDLGIAAFRGRFCNRLAVLTIATNAHDEILADLPRLFLDTSQGTKDASRPALRFAYGVRNVCKQRCRAAGDKAKARLYCQRTGRAANEER